jgi:DNA-binding response OmpR family regulator
MKKVLCVDDEPSLLQLYKDELSEEGYEVILAKSGQEGLIKFEEECPDVVIMDIRIPGMDGIHAMTALMAKDRGTQIILNSAYPMYRENFMTWGATAFVIKSSDLSELKQKIREALKNKERRPRPPFFKARRDHLREFDDP